MDLENFWCIQQQRLRATGLQVHSNLNHYFHLTNIFVALRVEWCKARARAHRWEEEVQLLHEEMRRIIAFLEWHADWWDAEGSRRHFSSPQAAEGAFAYAHRQARLRCNMASHFKSVWSGIPSAPLITVVVDPHSN